MVFGYSPLLPLNKEPLDAKDAAASCLYSVYSVNSLCSVKLQLLVETFEHFEFNKSALVVKAPKVIIKL